LEKAVSGKADRDPNDHPPRRVIVLHLKIDKKDGFKIKFYNGVCIDEATKSSGGHRSTHIDKTEGITNGGRWESAKGTIPVKSNR
jgi:hypothetical protein